VVLDFVGPRDASSEIKIIRLGALLTITKQKSPQTWNIDGGAAGVIKVPRNAPVTGLEALIMPLPKFPTSRSLLKAPKSPEAKTRENALPAPL
jgi:hypothetical protein